MDDSTGERDGNIAVTRTKATRVPGIVGDRRESGMSYKSLARVGELQEKKIMLNKLYTHTQHSLTYIFVCVFRKCQALYIKSERDEIFCDAGCVYIYFHQLVHS